MSEVISLMSLITQPPQFGPGKAGSRRVRAGAGELSATRALRASSRTACTWPLRVPQPLPGRVVSHTALKVSWPFCTA